MLVVLGLVLTSAAAYLAGIAQRGDGAEPAAASAPTTTLTSNSALTDRTATADDQIAAARQATIEIPDGHYGIAITLPFTSAGGGYVSAGDEVDVFAVEATSPATPVLVASTVLDVSVEVAPRITTGTPERPSAGQITYLLAVPSSQAPDVIAAVQTKTIYIALRADVAGALADAAEGPPPEQALEGGGG